jgi:hypothetical protein
MAGTTMATLPEREGWTILHLLAVSDQHTAMLKRVLAASSKQLRNTWLTEHNAACSALAVAVANGNVEGAMIRPTASLGIAGSLCTTRQLAVSMPTGQWPVQKSTCVLVAAPIGMPPCVPCLPSATAYDPQMRSACFQCARPVCRQADAGQPFAARDLEVRRHQGVVRAAACMDTQLAMRACVRGHICCFSNRSAASLQDHLMHAEVWLHAAAAWPAQQFCVLVCPRPSDC